MTARRPQFLMTEDHLKLARRANIGNNFGPAELDPKRPFGNSDVEMDIAEILGFDLFEDADGDKHLSARQRELAEAFLNDMVHVVQILVTHPGEDPLGTWYALPYSSHWKREP